MRTLSMTALVLLSSIGVAAPALGEKPPKWEYAELSYRTVPGRAAGVRDDGTEVPAVPASVAIRLIRGADEQEAKSWAELAEKLKAPSFKKDASAASQKIQVLNLLGGEGWELMEQQSGAATAAVFDRGDRGAGFPAASRTSGASTWLLKRRVP